VSAVVHEIGQKDRGLHAAIPTSHQSDMGLKLSDTFFPPMVGMMVCFIFFKHPTFPTIPRLLKPIFFFRGTPQPRKLTLIIYYQNPLKFQMSK